MEEEELQSDIESTQEEALSNNNDFQSKTLTGTKIIRKYDVDYNIFMK
jgi:hypothetical protein